MRYFVHCTHPDGRSVGFAGLNKDEAEKTAKSWTGDGYECRVTSNAEMRATPAATARWLVDPELASLIDRLHRFASNEDDGARFNARMSVEFPNYKPLISDASHASTAAQYRRWAEMLKKL